MISALFAMAILGTSSFVLDRGHLFSAPAGVVEIGQPTLIQGLDAVVVIAKR